jgi:hypothetical protein
MSQVQAQEDAAATDIPVSRSNRQIPERWRLLAALMLLATGTLALVVVIAGVVSYGDWFNSFHSDCQDVCFTPALWRSMQALGISRTSMAAYWIVVDLTFFFTYFGVAALIYWRRPDDRLAWLGSFCLLTLGTAFGSLPAVLSDVHPDWRLPAAIIGNENVLAFPSLILFFFLFPSGTFVPGWTRWVAFGFVGEYLVSGIFPHSPVSFIASSSPVAVLVPLLALSSVVLEQIYRYRRVSTPVERQQTKWIVFGSTAALVSFLLLGYVLGILFRLFFGGANLSLIPDVIIVTIIYLTLLLIPVSFAVAILRYRLWDVDVLINRTLVYGLVTGVLILVYAGCILVSQTLVRSFLNQTSDLAIIASTLLVAALFQPVRSRIQQGIDRRFYRHKFDAARILSTFAAALGSDVDLNKICEDLVSVVQETMQPEHISLRLFQPLHREGEGVEPITPQRLLDSGRGTTLS